MSRAITHTPAPVLSDNNEIVPGVVYEDFEGSNRYQWYLGLFIFNGRETVPALVSLYTGVVYKYRSGKLPGKIRKAAPGTITITVS